MSETGARLIIGIEGQLANESNLRLIDETGAAGVILFAKNLVDADQAHGLITSIRSAIDRPLIFAIDQEEGTVIRLARGLTVFPGNACLGRTDDEDLSRKAGFASANQMASLGFDLVLAPVVDLRGLDSNPITGNRSFGNDAGLVTRMARAYLRGMSEAKVASCIKHFPGLGAADVDPHLDLPQVPEEVDLRTQLEPFENLIMSCDAIMTTHLIMKGLDVAEPVTFSGKVVTELLRKSMGFKRAIISDDMLMGGARREGGLNQGVMDSIAAGHDAVLICHEPQRIREAAQVLHEAWEEGRVDRREHESAKSRLLQLRRRQPDETRMTLPDYGPLAAEIAKRGLELLGDPRRLSFLKTDRVVVLAGFQVPPSVEEEGGGDLARLAQEELQKQGFYEPILCSTVAELSSLTFDRLVVPVAGVSAIDGAHRALRDLQNQFPDRCLLILAGPTRERQVLLPEGLAVDLGGCRRAQMSAAIEFLSRDIAIAG